jgi:hypothetical protein
VIHRIPLWTLLAAICSLGVLLLTPIGAARGDEPGIQTLRFQLSLPRELPGGRFWAEIERLGQPFEVPLTDDGSLGPDMPWDGVFHGIHHGEYARYVVVTVVAELPGESPRVLYTGVEWTGDPRVVELGYRLLEGGGDHLHVVRSAIAYPNNRMQAELGFRYVIAFGWGLFVLAYVAFLLWRTRREGEA